jgi:DnaJ-domain-containing protein 1
MPTTAKAKKPFGGNYRTYDTSTGFGGPEQWNSAFEQRMGIETAKEVLGDSSPFAVLGVDLGSAWEAIKKAYRARVKETHPDLNSGLDGSEFRKVQAAYEILEKQYNQ